MKKSFEKTYHELEKDHWWFKSRRSYILSLLKPYDPKRTKILDVGCSSGILLSELQAQGFGEDQLWGVDISAEAIRKCRERGIGHAYQMDAQQIVLDEKFDVIIASDCLEHLQEDSRAVESWCRLLKPGGELYVFVPAFSFLWSAHDVANMHFRRYTQGELKRVLGATDLKIVRSGYWNFSLFIPVSILRLLARTLPGRNAQTTGDLKPVPAAVNGLLLKLVSFENFLLRYLHFPFGVSTYCIARKG